ncbi:hypothetical protein AgCh_017307 [Apium graveolens]
MARLRRTARKSVPGGPYRVEGFRLPEQVVVFLSEKALSQKVTATLSLAPACSLAGIAVLYAKDLAFCKVRLSIPCARFDLSIALAFATWLLTALSSHVMFWILASV